LTAVCIVADDISVVK